MINEAIIHSLVLHKVGNKQNDEGINYSKSEMQLDDELKSLLTTFFISSFKTDEYYNLFHDSDLSMNEVFKYVSEIFDQPESLYDNSLKLVKHLYDQGDHPKIKAGEFYISYFRDCIVDGEPVEAVGLFKSEQKDTFLKIYPTTANYIIESEEGINIKKLDKACIIFNTEREQGFLVSVVDGAGKGSETQYWRDGFLHVCPRKDAYTKTQHMLHVCKNFVTEELPANFETNKADQADLLNRSMQYFKSHDTFDKPEFEREVLQQPEVIDSFRSYDQEYSSENNIPLEASFDIAPQAVKKQAKVFKNVIKLDKNFHLYIHGDRSLIEKGEEDGKKFYKIYFQEES